MNKTGVHWAEYQLGMDNTHDSGFPSPLTQLVSYFLHVNQQESMSWTNDLRK